MNDTKPTIILIKSSDSDEVTIHVKNPEGQNTTLVLKKRDALDFGRNLYFIAHEVADSAEIELKQTLQEK